MARHDSYKLTKIEVVVERKDKEISLYTFPTFVDGSADYDKGLGNFHAKVDTGPDGARFYGVTRATPAPSDVPAEMWQEALSTSFKKLYRVVGLRK